MGRELDKLALGGSRPSCVTSWRGRWRRFCCCLSISPGRKGLMELREAATLISASTCSVPGPAPHARTVGSCRCCALVGACGCRDALARCCCAGIPAGLLASGFLHWTLPPRELVDVWERGRERWRIPSPSARGKWKERTRPMPLGGLKALDTVGLWIRTPTPPPVISETSASYCPFQTCSCPLHCGVNPSGGSGDAGQSH